MQTLQVSGKQITASKLRGLLFAIANFVPRNADVLGSIDSNEYGAQCSFVFGDVVLGLTFTETKGGTK